MRAFIEKTFGSIPKAGLLAEGVVLLLTGIGFAIGSPAVTWLWPFMDQSMTGVLLAALLVSYGSGSIFVACTVDWRAATSGGALALVIGFGGFALAMAWNAFTGQGPRALPQAIVLGMIALGSAYVFYASLRGGPKSEQFSLPPAPLMLRGGLLVLALGVAVLGFGLLAGWQGMLPWRVDATTAVLVGWLFIGFAADYVLTSLQGSTSACETLLCGLFVYDAVLLFPLLNRVMAPSSEAHAILFETIVGVVATAAFAAYYLARGYGRTWHWSNALSA